MIRQNRIRFVHVLLLLLLCTGTYRSAAVEGVASGTVFFLPDTNGLIGDAYLELYWQINPFSLHYRKDTVGALVARVQTGIVIRHDTGIVLEDHYMMYTDPAAPEQASARNILELKRLRLPYGTFRVELTLTEPDFPQRPFVYTQDINIPPPLPDAACYSDIQMVDTLYAATEKDNVFSRNGYIQIPLAVNFIDDDRKTLRYYAELYQADRIEPELYPLVQHAYISKREDGGMIPYLQQRDTIPAAPVIPVIGSFDLSPVASGNYYLSIRLLDRGERELASKTCFFQLVNKHPVARDAAPAKEDDTTEGTGVVFLDMSKTFVSAYSFPQVKAMLEMLLPVSDVWERKTIENFLRKPDEMYMRYFIYNHFLKIDGKDPEKAWKDFSDKVREVNRLFGSTAMPGYKTDRGFIYLKYGKPSDRILVKNEPGALPYEIWQYYSLGKQSMEGIFLFYQPGSSVQDYRLLHSTVNGELRNSQWRTLLYTKGGANANPNSRAEQYIRSR